MGVDLIIKVVVFCLCTVVLFWSMDVLNRMTHKSNHFMRLAFVLACCSSFAEMVLICAGYTPSIAELMSSTGMLFFFFGVKAIQLDKQVTSHTGRRFYDLG